MRDRLGPGVQASSSRGRGQKSRAYYHFGDYTPLKKPQAEILMEIRGRGNTNVLPAPPRMRNNLRRIESGKYCNFHRDYGHDTNYCNQLRDAIEDAIRKGYLKYYVAENNNKTRQERNTQRRQTQEP